MGKLQLNVEALTVESFDTGEGSKERGTVRARGADCTDYNTCWCATGEARCEATVPFTQYSCLSNIIACPIFNTDQGSCAGGACNYSDAHTCTFCNTEDRSCWYCP